MPKPITGIRANNYVLQGTLCLWVKPSSAGNALLICLLKRLMKGRWHWIVWNVTMIFWVFVVYVLHLVYKIVWGFLMPQFMFCLNIQFFRQLSDFMWLLVCCRQRCACEYYNRTVVNCWSTLTGIKKITIITKCRQTNAIMQYWAYHEMLTKKASGERKLFVFQFIFFSDWTADVKIESYKHFLLCSLLREVCSLTSVMLCILAIKRWHCVGILTRTLITRKRQKLVSRKYQKHMKSFQIVCLACWRYLHANHWLLFMFLHCCGVS